MRWLKRMFRQEPEPAQEAPLVLVFVPALVAVLKAAEDNKGAPLTQDEVIDIRDHAVCMAVSFQTALEMEAERGYADIAPETAWDDWCALRASF